MVLFTSSSKASHQGAHDFKGWFGREVTTSPGRETVVQNAKAITERQSRAVIALYANVLSVHFLLFRFFFSFGSREHGV
jgi:hypothetical protein